MIEYLKGRLLRADGSHAVIDVGGVGYGVDVPESTLSTLPEPGGEVALHTAQIVREDALDLYGFATIEERTVFHIFLAVSGIGPRTALDVLSSVSIPELAGAIQTGRVEVLTRIPGVGRKRAERLILELRDRVKDFPTAVPSLAAGAVAPADGGGAPGGAGVFQDAVDAMVALGFKPAAASRQVASAQRAAGDADLSVEELVKRALQSGR